VEQQRAGFSSEHEEQVRAIIQGVRRDGDRAFVSYTERFDGVRLDAGGLEVPREEIEQAARGFGADLYAALETAVRRVRDFHRRVTPPDWEYTDGLGNRLGQRAVPLRRVGVYVPGGTAVYPSTLVMTAVPAQAAGVEEVVVVSPPGSFRQPSALCAALTLLDRPCRVFRVGGVQGVAALAWGTETVPRVDKIVGPGSARVTLAKQLLYGQVDIDLVAGPSEVLVVTDGTVDPRVTAADLLAQAEHDWDARAVCVTPSPEVAREVSAWADRLAAESPRREIAEASLRAGGRVYLVADLEQAVEVANLVAPEHLELQTADPRALLPRVRNAGAIFLGRHTPEAFGDYVAGPSHVLPTGGTARFFSPLNSLSFMKLSSVVEMSERGMDALAAHARVIAEHEGLPAHALSITCRQEGS
jgi:histidinol dehydrogenase